MKEGRESERKKERQRHITAIHQYHSNCKEKRGREEKRGKEQQKRVDKERERDIKLYYSLTAGVMEMIWSMLLPAFFKNGVQLYTYIQVYKRFHIVDIPVDSTVASIICFLGVDLGYYCMYLSSSFSFSLLPLLASLFPLPPEYPSIPSTIFL